MNTSADSFATKNHLSATPFIITLVMLIGLAFFLNANFKTNGVTSDPIPMSEFSAVRAKTMLEDLLKEEIPHPVDSEANRVVEARLVEKLRAMGYQETIQDTQVCHDYDAGITRCTRVRNIIVSIEGSEHQSNLVKGDSAKNGILLAAHYDSVTAGPGANDAGIAVAALLEISRLLALEPQPKNDIVILFNEGEEFGLFGARGFMQQHPLAKTLKLAINIEARGSEGQSVMFETGEDSGWLVSEYAASTTAPLSSSLFYEVYKVLPNDTDLTIFKEHGLQGLNFAHGGNLPYYHTPLDSLANTQLGTIQHHGDNVWGVLQNIKDKDFTQLNEANIVYTDMLGQFIVQWQEPTSLILSIVAFLLMIVAAWKLSTSGHLHGASIRRGVYTFFAILILLSASGLAIQLLTQMISGGNEPWRVNNLPMQITLWSALALIGFLVGGWFSKKSDPINFLLGLLICWITLALVTSWLVVGISFLFIIPSLITVLTILIIPFISKNNSTPIILAIASLSIAIMFMPIVYVLEQMVGYLMSLGIALMFSFIVASVTPLLAINSQTQKCPTRINYALLGLFLVGLIWTVIQPAYTSITPQPINLTHLQQNSGDSLIIAGTVKNPPSAALKAATQGSKLGQTVAWSNVESFNKTVPSQQLQQSQIKLVSNQIITTDNHQQRIITLQIESSGINFRELYIYAKKDSKLSTIQYANNTLNYANEKALRNGFYEFHCRGLTCQSVEATLTFNSTSPIELQIVTSLSGLPASDNSIMKNRGEAATTRQFGDQTLIIKDLLIN